MKALMMGRKSQDAARLVLKELDLEKELRKGLLRSFAARGSSGASPRALRRLF